MQLPEEGIGEGDSPKHKGFAILREIYSFMTIVLQLFYLPMLYAMSKVNAVSSSVYVYNLYVCLCLSVSSFIGHCQISSLK